MGRRSDDAQRAGVFVRDEQQRTGGRVRGRPGLRSRGVRLPRPSAAGREDPHEDPQQRCGKGRGPPHQLSFPLASFPLASFPPASFPPASAPGESAKVKMDWPAATEMYCCPSSAKLIGAARMPPPT